MYTHVYVYIFIYTNLATDFEVCEEKHFLENRYDNNNKN